MPELEFAFESEALGVWLGLSDGKAKGVEQGLSEGDTLGDKLGDWLGRQSSKEGEAGGGFFGGHQLDQHQNTISWISKHKNTNINTKSVVQYVPYMSNSKT